MMKYQRKCVEGKELRGSDKGIDISLIDANLRRTPTERALLHQRALELALALREAGKKYYDGLSETDKTARSK